MSEVINKNLSEIIDLIKKKKLNPRSSLNFI